MRRDELEEMNLIDSLPGAQVGRESSEGGCANLSIASEPGPVADAIGDVKAFDAAISHGA